MKYKWPLGTDPQKKFRNKMLAPFWGLMVLGVIILLILGFAVVYVVIGILW